MQTKRDSVNCPSTYVGSWADVAKNSRGAKLDAAAFSAGAAFSHIHALLAGDIADGGDAAAYALFALLEGVTRLVGQIIGALRDIVAGFLAAHGREQDTQTKSYA